MLFCANIGVFPFILGVFIDKEILNQEVSRMMEEPFELKGNAVASTIDLVHKKTNELAICVYFDIDRHPDDSIINSIVHESVHVKQKVMKHIGEKKIGIETEAYFIDSVFNCIMQEINSLKADRLKLIEGVVDEIC